MYEPQKISLPKGEKLNFRLPAKGTDGAEKQSGAVNWNEIEWKIREYVSGYYGLISRFDFNVGRLLNWLDANSLAENTIVVFLADHGDMLGQNGRYCTEKLQPYRAAAQLPLLFRCSSRFPGGKRVNSLVDVSVDTMPTPLQMCGVESPDGTQGVSYQPLLEGSDVPARNHVQYQNIGSKQGFRRGIRTMDWLYVRDQDRPLLLFDQNSDREELVNLVNDPSHAEILAELDARVIRNMHETCDTWKLPNFPPKVIRYSSEIKMKMQEEVKFAAIDVP